MHVVIFIHFSSAQALLYFQIRTRSFCFFLELIVHCILKVLEWLFDVECDSLDQRRFCLSISHHDLGLVSGVSVGSWGAVLWRDVKPGQSGGRNQVGGIRHQSVRDGGRAADWGGQGVGVGNKNRVNRVKEASWSAGE